MTQAKIDLALRSGDIIERIQETVMSTPSVHPEILDPETARDLLLRTEDIVTRLQQYLLFIGARWQEEPKGDS